VTSPRVLLPGFEYLRIDVEGVRISCAVRGAGPPVLMLHGYPQNHLAWRHVAPALADDHTVMLADLRGYSDSGKPDPDTVGPFGIIEKIFYRTGRGSTSKPRGYRPWNT